MRLSIFQLDDKRSTKSVILWLVDNEVSFDFQPEDGTYEIRMDERKASVLEAAFKEKITLKRIQA